MFWRDGDGSRQSELRAASCGSWAAGCSAGGDGDALRVTCAPGEVPADASPSLSALMEALAAEARPVDPAVLSSAEAAGRAAQEEEIRHLERQLDQARGRSAAH